MILKEPKYGIGQLVKYTDSDSATKECPHCGQDYEESGPEYEVTTVVVGYEAEHTPDGKGGLNVSYSYQLKDLYYRLSEDEVSPA